MRDIDYFTEANIDNGNQTLSDFISGLPFNLVKKTLKVVKKADARVLQGYRGPDSMRNSSPGTDSDTLNSSYGVTEVKFWHGTSKNYNFIPVAGWIGFGIARGIESANGDHDWRNFYFDENSGDMISEQEAKDRKSRNKDSSDRNNRGNQLEEEGKFEEAIEEFKQAYENSHSSNKDRNIFKENMKLAQEKLANKHYNEGVKHFNSGEFKNAADKFRDAKQTTNDKDKKRDFNDDIDHAESRISYTKGNELRDQQKYDEALNEYQKAIDRAPHSKTSSKNLYKDNKANVFQLQGQDLWKAENFKDAKKKYQDAERTVADNSKRNKYKIDVTHAESAILNQDGVRFINEHKYTDAAKMIEAAIKIVPKQKVNSLNNYKNNLAEAYHLQGFELWKESDFTGAGKMFKKAMNETVNTKKQQEYKVDMNHAEAMVLNDDGNKLKDEHKLSNAITKYKAAISLVPKQKVSSLNMFKNNLAETYHMQGVDFWNESNFRGAADKFKDAMDETVDSKKKQEYKVDMDHAEAMVLNDEGNKLRSEKKLNEAVAKYQAAISLVPKQKWSSVKMIENNLANVYHSLALQFLIFDDLKSAAENYKFSLNHHFSAKSDQLLVPELAHVRFLMSQAFKFLNAGKYKESIENFQRAHSIIDPVKFSDIEKLNNNDFVKQLNLRWESIDADLDDPQTFLEKPTTNLLLFKETLEKAINLQPNNSQYHELMKVNNKKLEQNILFNNGVKLYREANQLKVKGDFSEAREKFQEAKKMLDRSRNLIENDVTFETSVDYAQLHFEKMNNPEVLREGDEKSTPLSSSGDDIVRKIKPELMKNQTKALYDEGLWLLKEAWDLESMEANSKFRMASEKFQKALQLEPDNTEFKKMFNVSSFSSEGNKTFEEGTKLTEQGNQLKMEGKHGEAEEKIKAAKMKFRQAFRDSNYDPRFKSAVDFVQKDFEKMKNLEVTQKENPNLQFKLSKPENVAEKMKNDASSLYNQGFAHLKEGWGLDSDMAKERFKIASDHFEKALQLDPDNAEIEKMFNVSSFRSEGNKTFEEGTKLTEQGNQLKMEGKHGEAEEKIKAAKMKFRQAFRDSNYDIRFKSAVEFVQKDLEKMSSSASVQESNTKMAENSAGTEDNNVETMKQRAETLFNSGLVAWNEGWHSEPARSTEKFKNARELFKEAFKMSPNNLEYKKLLKASEMNVENNGFFKQGVLLQKKANKMKVDGNFKEAKELQKESKMKFRQGFENSGFDSRFKASIDYFQQGFKKMEHDKRNLDQIQKMSNNKDNIRNSRAESLYIAGQSLWFNAWGGEESGDSESAKRKFKQAVDMFTRATELDPDNADYNNFAAVSKLKLEANDLFNEALRVQIAANRLKSTVKLEESKKMYQAAKDKYQEAFEASGKDSRLKGNVNFVNGSINVLDNAINLMNIKSSSQQTSSSGGGLYEQGMQLQSQANQLKQNQKFNEALQKLQLAKDKFQQGSKSEPNDAKYKTAVQNVQKIINEVSVSASQSSGKDVKTEEKNKNQTVAHFSTV